MTENGGDIFVKENTKGEAAKKMFDGELCSLQVFILRDATISWDIVLKEGFKKREKYGLLPYPKSWEK